MRPSRLFERNYLRELFWAYSLWRGAAPKSAVDCGRGAAQKIIQIGTLASSDPGWNNLWQEDGAAKSIKGGLFRISLLSVAACFALLPLFACLASENL
jgi:hypothetical protein